jgi:hypothetical protein
MNIRKILGGYAVKSAQHTAGPEAKAGSLLLPFLSASFWALKLASP